MPASRPESGHIVDQLIAERLPGLIGTPAWPLLRPVLYALLDYRKARRLADEVGPLSGEAAVAHVSAMLSLQLEVTGLENVPAEGPLLIVANHPTGPADGIGIFDALKTVRRDLHFYANADTVRIAPGLSETVIGIEGKPGEKRARESSRRALVRTREILEAGQALFIFPAGRISRRVEGRLEDWPWQTSALSLARKHKTPVLPIHMHGPRSKWVPWIGRVLPPIREVTLFHEFLNTRGKRFRVVIGPVIPPEAFGGDGSGATERLKRYVERVLPEDPAAVFSA
ncbi:MAG TPA: 1-acyl-sn-glycerol-3-phosphate acyltransferase [Caulobacteraceae bacterium]|jgi:putative hemolysin